MFGIGETELVLILLFAFMIFGPDKLPGMGKTLGRALRQFRNAQEGFTQVVQTEIVDPATEAMSDNPKKPNRKRVEFDEDADIEGGEEGAAAKRTETFAERKKRLEAERKAREAAEKEAAEAAAHYRLDNLTVLVDNNGLQIDGRNQDVMDVRDIAAKFAAFGFETIDVADGNDIVQVLAALDQPGQTGKPRMILCHTVKGKGVSFMENQAGWHGKAPNAEQCRQALQELEG